MLHGACDYTCSVALYPIKDVDNFGWCNDHNVGGAWD